MGVYYKTFSSKDIKEAALKDVKEVSFTLNGMNIFSHFDTIVRLPIDLTKPGHEFLTKGPLAIFTPDAYIVITNKRVEVEEDSELVTKVI